MTSENEVAVETPEVQAPEEAVEMTAEQKQMIQEYGVLCARAENLQNTYIVERAKLNGIGGALNEISERIKEIEGVINGA